MGIVFRLGFFARPRLFFSVAHSSYLAFADSSPLLYSSRTHSHNMGKVHGGLARAGKVKNQTPKVEKTTKAKRKTGRAKKRVQYVKRFVTVVPTFGGKRPGPNPAPQKGLPGAAAAAAGKK